MTHWSSLLVLLDQLTPTPTASLTPLITTTCFNVDKCTGVTIVMNVIIMVSVSWVRMGILLFTVTGRRQEKHTVIQCEKL